MLETLIKSHVQARFMDRMIASARGRAHVLATVADAEDTDEGAIFDKLVAEVDDPELHRMIRVHQADEKRHAQVFLAALDRQGVGRPIVPEAVKVLPRLDRALGGFMDRPLATGTDIMEVYLVLQVIEERAVTQFGLLTPVFRRHDPGTADVFDAVAKDEARHLRYCHAIAKRYAPDAATLATTLTRYRAVEAEAFTENSAANMDWVLGQRLLDVGPVELRLWRGFDQATRNRRRPDRTAYWGMPPGAQPGVAAA